MYPSTARIPIPEFSGEQMILGHGKKSSEEEHLARYQFTKTFVDEKSVLDFACGTGYGTAMIKSFGAKKVIGIDISHEAISYAEKLHNADGITFLEASAASLPLQNNSIDIVVSFETIEHLTDTDRDRCLQELARVLKRDGVLLLSTPNRRITSPNSIKPLNRFHVREFTLKELIQTLETGNFTVTKIYGQRVRKKILAFTPVRKILSLLEKIARKSFPLHDKARGPFVIPFGSNEEPRYYVIIARRRI